MPGARSPEAPSDAIVRRDAIVDLTPNMAPDGSLRWNVPAGRWTILRLGHTPTGAMNAPSPESGRGLEVDKLSKAALDAYWDGFLAKLVADSPDLVGRTFVATHIDSWETGSQNWTPLFREEFRRLRGYDPLLYLPIYAGYVVDSSEVSDRFLYDVRQTVSDLLLQNYAGHMRELAHRHGMRLTIEAYGDTTVDNLAYAARADEPMAEFWSWTPYGAASTLPEMTGPAHFYGKTVVGAEAFTATDAEKWLGHPGNIKAMGDWAFSLGINRFVFHRYALQPWRDRRPGMSMGPWGLHYERTQTWWDQTVPWHRYLSRCQFLLRQGQPVVDILSMAPEGTARTFNPPSPLRLSGYKADPCSAEAVIQHLAVRHGVLVSPSGMRYRALLLPSVEAMTPALLRKLLQLAKAGALLIGDVPERSPSLTAYPACDAEVAKLARQLPALPNLVRQGTADVVLSRRGIPPDFKSDRILNWMHRRAGATDIYFVANPGRSAVHAACEFRVTGKVPELWDPLTGRRTVVAAYLQSAKTTRLTLNLEPSGSVFVIFRPPVRPDDPVVRIVRNGATVWPQTLRQARIRIRKALWGPAGDERRTKDVTDQVQRMVDRVGPAFTVAELASEGDPAVNIVKTLRVEYEVAGRVATAFATDPEMITFEMPADVAAPIILRKDLNNRLTAEIRSPGTYVVYFRSGRRAVFRSRPLPRPLQVNGRYEVTFPAGWGAPPRIALPQLVPWNEHSDDGVRFFSGTATYRTVFRFEPPAAPASAPVRWRLDLGRVEVIARVRLNGKDLGILWRPPFVVDVTSALRRGENRLEIRVTNLWPNRMIGDEHLPEDSRRHPNGTLVEWPEWLQQDRPSPTGRLTFTSWRLWRKTDPLQPSGLIGPVRLIPVTVEAPER